MTNEEIILFNYTLQTLSNFVHNADILRHRVSHQINDYQSYLNVLSNTDITNNIKHLINDIKNRFDLPLKIQTDNDCDYFTNHVMHTLYHEIFHKVFTLELDFVSIDNNNETIDYILNNILLLSNLRINDNVEKNTQIDKYDLYIKEIDKTSQLLNDNNPEFINKLVELLTYLENSYKVIKSNYMNKNYSETYQREIRLNECAKFQQKMMDIFKNNENKSKCPILSLVIIKMEKIICDILINKDKKSLIPNNSEIQLFQKLMHNIPKLLNYNIDLDEIVFKMINSTVDVNQFRNIYSTSLSKKNYMNERKYIESNIERSINFSMNNEINLINLIGVKYDNNIKLAIEQKLIPDIFTPMGDNIVSDEIFFKYKSNQFFKFIKDNFKEEGVEQLNCYIIHRIHQYFDNKDITLSYLPLIDLLLKESMISTSSFDINNQSKNWNNIIDSLYDKSEEFGIKTEFLDKTNQKISEMMINEHINLNIEEIDYNKTLEEQYFI